MPGRAAGRQHGARGSRKDLRPAADRARPGRRLIACRLAAAAEDLPGQLAIPARLDAQKRQQARRFFIKTAQQGAGYLPGQLPGPARPGCLDELQDGCTVLQRIRKDLRPAADRGRPGRHLIAGRLAAAAEDLPGQLAMPARLFMLSRCLLSLLV